MKTLTFKVEQKHIDNGRRNSSRKCPVALALTDAGHLNVVVAVMPPLASVNGKVYDLNHHVTEFASRFDFGMTVEPCEFTITSETLK